MKELKKTKRLSVSIIGYIAIILIGLISLSKASVYFSQDEAQILSVIEEMSNEVFPDEALDFALNEEPGYLFIDVRNEYQYLQDHLENAINIPINHLLEDDYMKIYQQAQKDSLCMVFYGEDQIQANGAWMLVYQLGFDNSKMMLGGYDLIADPNFDPDQIDAYLIEEPKFDFYMIMEEARDQLENPELIQEKPAMQIIPVQRVENEIDEGGC